MIGYDTGTSGAGGRVPDPPAVRETWGRVDEWLRDRVDDVLEPVWDRVATVIEVTRWVLERVAIVSPVRHERWVTGDDERVCAECGPLHGMTWPEGEGVVPPLHVNCRCRREQAFVEWRTRYVDEWRLRWTTAVEWDWRMTGWR